MGHRRLTDLAQAPLSRNRIATPRLMLLSGCFVAVAALTGCASKGADLKTAEVDRTLYTSEVKPDAKASEPERISDEATIRNAVSAADVQTQGTQELAWANSETGSRGAITAMAEHQNGDQLCRRFTTSRESYDGVALYQGEACKQQSGDWRLQNFKPL
ncbi:RT0821/Lpp0805 family surface protein [Mesorhizobium sp. RP14(2022)]|jgi:surface antigen|uniref:RT0821/Lpp0805 family surface protein n=1 Tax=Mesorhizobium liriopis TaxID=2953882 RepID=A0ABT1C133_9HYPH|nr:RT0821/Lpp0805 family surface protein [Mesorhizobium liriopis]MCO6048529.1 RT0821/Lpp0805 family surface protein [Mesorhizobium liriopis]